MTAYEIMQSAQVGNNTEERLALVSALSALRTARPSNGSSAIQIAAARRLITQALRRAA